MSEHCSARWMPLWRSFRFQCVAAKRHVLALPGTFRHLAARDSENLPICYSLHAGPPKRALPRELLSPAHQRQVSHMISDGRGAEFAARRLRGRALQGFEAAACAYAGTEAQEDRGQLPTNYDRSAAGKAKKPRVFLRA